MQGVDENVIQTQLRNEQMMDPSQESSIPQNGASINPSLSPKSLSFEKVNAEERNSHGFKAGGRRDSVQGEANVQQFKDDDEVGKDGYYDLQGEQRASEGQRELNGELNGLDDTTEQREYCRPRTSTVNLDDKDSTQNMRRRPSNFTRSDVRMNDVNRNDVRSNDTRGTDVSKDENEMQSGGAVASEGQEMAREGHVAKPSTGSKHNEEEILSIEDFEKLRKIIAGLDDGGPTLDGDPNSMDASERMLNYSIRRFD